MIDVRTHTKKRKKTTKILGEEEKNFFEWDVILTEMNKLRGVDSKSHKGNKYKARWLISECR